LTTYAIIAVVSYLLGSIPFGYILVRLFLKQDIRTTGSGNIGATNVGRTGHKGLAIATLLLDGAKGYFAVRWLEVFGRQLLGRQFLTSDYFILVSVAAFFAVLGHCFPIWLKFSGGKGVATAAGAFIAIVPVVLIPVLLVFAIVVALFRYVSLGSVVAAAAFPVALYFWFSYDQGVSPPTLAMLFISLCSAIVILKHHANIRRLLAGTENRLGAKPKIPPPQQMEKQV
jgi:acyl phosphate:glycerol-3-phosphate acyltransferase